MSKKQIDVLAQMTIDGEQRNIEIKLPFTQEMMQDITSDEMRNMLKDLAEIIKQKAWLIFRFYKKDTNIIEKERVRKVLSHKKTVKLRR